MHEQWWQYTETAHHVQCLQFTSIQRRDLMCVEGWEGSGCTTENVLLRRRAGGTSGRANDKQFTNSERTRDVQ